MPEATKYVDMECWNCGKVFGAMPRCKAEKAVFCSKECEEDYAASEPEDTDDPGFDPAFLFMF